jgi:hypothetical protein
MSDPIQDFEARLLTHKRWAYGLGLLLVVALASGVMTSVYKQHQADAAVTRAAQLEVAVVEKEKAAQAKSAEAEQLAAEGKAKDVAAHQQDATIASLKTTLAKLKAEHPANVPFTPIETTQDQLITVQGTKIVDLEGSVVKYQSAFDSEKAAYDLSQQALGLERGRSDQLATALKAVPKERRWSLAVFGGRDWQGVKRYAGELGYSRGPVGVNLLHVDKTYDGFGVSIHY